MIGRVGRIISGEVALQLGLCRDPLPLSVHVKALDGHWPFGLTNAPAVFQALVNDELRDMLNHFVFV